MSDKYLCPFCNNPMEDIGEDEYKCLQLGCPLANHQSNKDFVFHADDIPKQRAMTELKKQKEWDGNTYNTIKDTDNVPRIR